MKWDQDLYPRDEPNPGRVAVLVVVFIAVTMFCVWWVSSMAMAAECPEGTEEHRITDAVTKDDTLWVFTGEGLNTFMQSLNDYGLMAGRPINVTKVIVAYDGHLYTVFFLNEGCIVYAGRAPMSVMERILPK